MLTERDLELLTAFVDGELTRRERKAVLRLVHRSSQARSVLQELQECAHRLRGLPRRKLGEAFAGQVLQTIADRGLQPTPQSRPSRRRGVPRWVGYATAACVMLAVALGIYIADRTRRSIDSGPVVAAKSEPKMAPAQDVPLRVTFKELASKPKQELLAKKLQRETAVHLDLTVRNNASAVGHLQDVLKRQGIKTIVDARTRANLKKGDQRQVEYLVYAENIGAKELATILRQLADEPKNQPAQQGTFESLVVTSLTLADRENVSGLLGIKTSDLDALNGKAESNLFDNTIIPAPKDKTTTTTPATLPRHERFAMILAKDGGIGSASDEVRTFLASRGQQLPGTVQVLLVIRQA